MRLWELLTRRSRSNAKNYNCYWVNGNRVTPGRNDAPRAASALGEAGRHARLLSGEQQPPTANSELQRPTAKAPNRQSLLGFFWPFLARWRFGG
jgi:hypothetical protein